MMECENEVLVRELWEIIINKIYAFIHSLIITV